MSLFKKSNRKAKNQRTRVNDSDDDNDNQSLDSDFNRINDKNKRSVKFDSHNDNSKSDDNFDDIYDTKPKIKSNPLLSFGDEEEEEEFKVRKSSYSRRLAKQSENKKKRKDVKKDKEVVSENNTIVDENKDKNENKNGDDLNVIWIKSEEIKTEPKEELKIFSGDQIESDSEYEENEAEEYRSNEPFHHFRGALERGVIPDAKTIYELKKQRQMARDIEELIIPIEDDDKYEELTDSRIVREDDDDKSDDEEDDQRISFAINRDNIEREKAREAFLMAQEENEEQSDKEDESEDELDRWEREQIKKGVRMPVIQMLSQEQASNRAISGLFVDNLNIVDMDIDRPFNKPKKTSSVPSRLLNRNRHPITLEDVVKRVGQQLQTLKESIAFNERQVVTLTAHLNESKQQIGRLSVKREELIDKTEDKTEVKTEITTEIKTETDE